MAAQWAALDNQKEISSFGPDFLYYEALIPLANVHIAPMPMSAMTMTIYVPLPIGQFAAQDSNVVLPPAYLSMIIYNLAVEVSLTPRFRRFEMQPGVIVLADRYKAEIRRFNAELVLGAPALAAAEAPAK